MDQRESAPNDPTEDLLQSVHTFPGPFRIKVIGLSDDAFAERVLAVAQGHVADPADREHSIRATHGGRHLAVTLDLQLQSASQVRAIYADLRQLEGLTMLL